MPSFWTRVVPPANFDAKRHRAFVAGVLRDGTPIHVARGELAGEIYLGVVYGTENALHVAAQGSGHQVFDYEVFGVQHGSNLSWDTPINGAIPPNSIAGSATTYIGRISYKGEKLIGEIREGRCHVIYIGEYISDNVFEVLTEAPVPCAHAAPPTRSPEKSAVALPGIHDLDMESDKVDVFNRASASETYHMPVTSLRKGGFVMIKGRPTKIVNIATDDSGQVHLVALDIFTGNELEELSPSTLNMEVPNITRKEYKLIAVKNGFLSLMDDGGETREDVALPEGEIGDEITAAVDEKLSCSVPASVPQCLVIVLSFCGESVVVSTTIGSRGQLDMSDKPHN